jgi:hypothetical protein
MAGIFPMRAAESSRKPLLLAWKSCGNARPWGPIHPNDFRKNRLRNPKEILRKPAWRELRGAYTGLPLTLRNLTTIHNMKIPSLKTSLAIAVLTTLGTLPAFSSTIVYWGGNAVVSANQAFSSKPTTYDPATDINPAVGANYYPDATGANPVFGGAMSVSASSGLIENNASGDRIAFQHGVNDGITFSAMILWNSANFLTNPIEMTLQSVSIGGVRQRSSSVAQDSQEIRLVLRQGDDYFISSAQSFNTTAATKSFTLDGSLGWFAFTPFNTGVATIGASVSAPSYDAPAAIGYYQQTRNNSGSSNQIGFDITSFEVTGEAVPEPSTWALLGAGAAFAAWRATRRFRR